MLGEIGSVLRFQLECHLTPGPFADILESPKSKLLERL